MRVAIFVTHRDFARRLDLEADRLAHLRLFEFKTVGVTIRARYGSPPTGLMIGSTRVSRTSRMITGRAAFRG